MADAIDELPYAEGDEERDYDLKFDEAMVSSAGSFEEVSRGLRRCCADAVALASRDLSAGRPVVVPHRGGRRRLYGDGLARVRGYPRAYVWDDDVTGKTYVRHELRLVVVDRHG